MTRAAAGLHTAAAPPQLLARDSELDALRGLLRDAVLRQRSAAVYVSGLPGTGKSASVAQVVREAGETLPPHCVVWINCMGLEEPRAVFDALVRALEDGSDTKADMASRAEALAVGRGVDPPARIVVLDEVDQLCTRGQDVLYRIFQWPFQRGVRGLLLIGIANALDLTDRAYQHAAATPHRSGLLPRLRRGGCEPQLLNFAPYDRTALRAIVVERLERVGAVALFSADALDLLTMRVAKSSGDARRTLDLCARSLEQASAADAAPGAPLVTMAAMARTVGTATVSPAVARVRSLPYRPRVVLGALVHAQAQLRRRHLTVGELQAHTQALCVRLHLVCVRTSEFDDVCSVLVAKALVEQIGRAREPRLRKLSARVQLEDVVFALEGEQDMDVLVRELQRGSG